MSLINKYRPQYFKEVAGQDSIVKTLVQSLNNNRIHNAYLFAGKYGTGKTTLARLLAVGLNCEKFKGDIPKDNKVNSFDIIEIDAASNRGIDEIRKLKENCCKNPWGKYRVYIIDEAHQLTSQASNAFLKTLEEPSSKTKFIFCTTEPWKLLTTIRSRCLSFYLKPIRFTDIKDRLVTILEQEKVFIKDERILYRIAENSNNTLRDAINSLDICLNNLSDNTLTAKIIEDSLDWVPEKEIYNLIDYLINKKSDKFFTQLNGLVSMGKRYEDIIVTLKQQVKEILFVKKNYTKGINKYKLQKIKELPYNNSELMKILNYLIKTESKITNFVNPKDISEYVFFKLLQK